MFDVFLSHNSKDKPAVRALGALLTEQGIKVWLDEDQLIPGRPWQPLLEKGIRESTAGAVLVGTDGLGPWEDEEMQALLSLAVREKKPVIPVLLPGAPKKPDLPAFLSNRTWVDMREGFKEDKLANLIWGITGKKPGVQPMSQPAQVMVAHQGDPKPALPKPSSTSAGTAPNQSTGTEASNKIGTTIPNPIIYAVGDVLGSWYYSHSKLNTLFGENGAPGDPPPGNCVEKSQEWLRRASNDPDFDALALLGKVLVDFMNRELNQDPHWKEGFERIQKALTDSDLAFHPGGQIMPTQREKRFRVALSFPGKRRAFVKDVAAYVARHLGQERVLYDGFHEAEFARPDLDTYLPNLYRTNSELIAIFLCADYAKKRWCKLEWRFVRQLMCTSENERIMLLSFDDIGAAPDIGILSGDGYVSIGDRRPQEIGELILQRLGFNTQSPRIAPEDQTAPEGKSAAQPLPMMAFREENTTSVTQSYASLMIHAPNTRTCSGRFLVSNNGWPTCNITDIVLSSDITLPKCNLVAIGHWPGRSVHEEGTQKLPLSVSPSQPIWVYFRTEEVPEPYCGNLPDTVILKVFFDFIQEPICKTLKRKNKRDHQYDEVGVSPLPPT